jgi:hypothetical protein
VAARRFISAGMVIVSSDLVPADHSGRDGKGKSRAAIPTTEQPAVLEAVGANVLLID